MPYHFTIRYWQLFWEVQKVCEKTMPKTRNFYLFLFRFYRNLKKLCYFGSFGRLNLKNISNKIKDCPENEISLTEMTQGLKAIRLSSMGGPYGLTSRFLRYLGGKIANIILGAIRGITLNETT